MSVVGQPVTALEFPHGLVRCGPENPVCVFFEGTVLLFKGRQEGPYSFRKLPFRFAVCLEQARQVAAAEGRLAPAIGQSPGFLLTGLPYQG